MWFFFFPVDEAAGVRGVAVGAGVRGVAAGVGGVHCTTGVGFFATGVGGVGAGVRGVTGAPDVPGVTGAPDARNNFFGKQTQRLFQLCLQLVEAIYILHVVQRRPQFEKKFIHFIA